MDIVKFNEKLSASDRYFTEYGSTGLYQRHVDYYNSKGYKLYYYKDFNLIEITDVRTTNNRANWKSIWGDCVFFLDESEYEVTMKEIGLAKDIYDQHIEAANLTAQMPLSFIYHNVLKVKE